MPTSSGLFPRNFKRTFPVAVRGEGCWIISSDGRRFLDASGQAAVVSIGHGVAEIGRAMAEQSAQIAFAHTSQFHSAPAEKLAARLLAIAPPNFHDGGRVHFTSGGSEATETAIKLARQYHLETGQKDRYRVLSRRQSYHGSTLGAMSVSGNVARRAPYEPLLADGATSRRASAITARLKKRFRSANSLARTICKSICSNARASKPLLLFSSPSLVLRLAPPYLPMATLRASLKSAAKMAFC